MYIRTQRALVVGVLVKFKEKFKVVEITKDTAMFIREKLPNVCIYKTMKSCGSKRGTYFVEETNSVLKLISQYKKSEKIIEEYKPTLPTV